MYVMHLGRQSLLMCHEMVFSKGVNRNSPLQEGLELLRALSSHVEAGDMMYKFKYLRDNNISYGAFISSFIKHTTST